jgi:hypothetical protein
MKDVNTKRTESKPAARNTVRIGMGELPMYERTLDHILILRLVLLR